MQRPVQRQQNLRSAHTRQQPHDQEGRAGATDSTVKDRPSFRWCQDCASVYGGPAADELYRLGRMLSPVQALHHALETQEAGESCPDWTTKAYRFCGTNWRCGSAGDWSDEWSKSSIFQGRAATVDLPE